MKKIIALAALSALAAPAFAEPVKVAQAEFGPLVDVSPVQKWAGAYAGLTFNKAMNGEDKVGISRNDKIVDEPGTMEIDGTAAGLRLGYRMQTGGAGAAFVSALEVGYDMGGFGDEIGGAYPAAIEVNSMLALRGKFGVTNNTGSTWFYGSVGAGMLDYDYSFTAPDYSYKAEGETSIGYLLGAGVEHQFTDQISVAGEYEFANFGKETLGSSEGYTTRATPSYQTARIGLNFRF